MQGPSKSSKFVSRVKVPAPGGKVILSPGKVPNEEERVPQHILCMNKFTVVAYHPFILDPAGDMTVLRFRRPHSVPFPGLRRILFHVPCLPGVFLLACFSAAGYRTAATPQARSMANPPFRLTVSCRNTPGEGCG